MLWNLLSQETMSFFFFFTRDKDLPQKLPEENITDYQVKWTENGIDLNNEGTFSCRCQHFPSQLTW